jgi:SAM-dependent methyltransferase
MTMSVSSARTPDERQLWLERSRAAWNERAAGWDTMSDERPDERRQELERVIAALDARAGTRLLDAGCGTGQWAIGLARAGCDVTGVDLAPEMLRRARANADRAGVAIEWREGDIGNLADPDASFDAVQCRCALQFSPVPAGVLREFRRVLRPGGRLFVAVPGALSPIYDGAWRRFVDPATFNTRIVPWELEALLDHLGWRILDGWGWFGRGGNGIENTLSADEVRGLPRRLQQAAATAWVTIATPAAPPDARDGRFVSS